MSLKKTKGKLSKTFVLLLAMLITLMLLSGCKKSSQGESFRIPLLQNPKQLDPQVSDDKYATTVLLSTFEGLTRLDEVGNVVEGMASWEISDDGLEYTFKLVESYWSNEDKVTAYDFLFAMRRTVDITTQSTMSSKLNNIVNAKDIIKGKAKPSSLGVSAPDENTLVINLIKPDKNFLYELAFPPFFPCQQRFFTKTEGQYGLQAKYILTNGAFTIRSWTHDKVIILQKNEHYHDANSIKPSTVRFAIESYDDPIKSLKKGDLDAYWIKADQVEQARKAKLPLDISQDSIKYLWFNNKNKALTNINVRKALRDTIEWEKVEKQMHPDHSKPAQGFAATDSTLNGREKYRTQQNILQPKVNSKALEMFKNGLAQQDMSSFGSFQLLCLDDEYSLGTAQAIVQSWQKHLSIYSIGIKQMSQEQLDEAMSKGEYSLALYSQSAPGELAIDAFYMFATDNYANFDNNSYKKEYSKTGATNREQLEMLEKKLWDYCPSVPISINQDYIAFGKDVQGMVVHPFGGGLFKTELEFKNATK